MFVTYPVQDAVENDFKRDFIHLYHRIRQLGDNLFSCHIKGHPFSLERRNSRPFDPPRILEAMFDERYALRYERKAEQFFSTRPTKNYVMVLQPTFPITFLIDLGFGVKESFTYDFATYGKESLTAFCQKVCKRCEEVFQYYFSPLSIPRR